MEPLCSSYLLHFDDFSATNYRGAAKEADSQYIALQVSHSLISKCYPVELHHNLNVLNHLVYTLSSTSVPSGRITPYKSHDNVPENELNVN